MGKLYPHPTQPGWLIGTPEVERLLNALHRLIMPDGAIVHPLHFHPPDFTGADLVAAQAWAVDTVLQGWRGGQRALMGLSSAQWQDLAYAGKAAHCREWIADQSQPFGLAREAAVRGLSNLQMAQLIIGQNNAWLDANDQIDAAYTAARAAIEAAEDVAAIEAVLVGLLGA